MAQFDSYMMQPYPPANYITYKRTFGPRLAGVSVLAGSGLWMSLLISIALLLWSVLQQRYISQHRRLLLMSSLVLTNDTNIWLHSNGVIYKLSTDKDNLRRKRPFQFSMINQHTFENIKGTSVMLHGHTHPLGPTKRGSLSTDPMWNTNP